MPRIVIAMTLALLAPYVADAAEPRLEPVVQTGHTGPVLSVSWSNDGKRLATGSLDNTAIIWNAETGEKVRTLAEHGKKFASVSWSNNVKRLATALFDLTAIIWNVDTGQKVLTLNGHNSLVTSVSWCSDGKRLATGSFDNTAIIWNAATGEKVHTLAGHTNTVTSVSWSGDGKRLMTGSWDGTTRLWDAASGKELCSLISFDEGKDWLVVAPEGYFDASPNGAKFMSYRIAGTNNMVPLESCRKKFERPGLLALIIKGEDYRKADNKR